MIISLSFLALFAALILGTYQGVRKYRTAMNPLTFIMLNEAMSTILFSGLVVTYVMRPNWLHQKYSDDYIITTIWLSILCLFGNMAAFVVPTAGLTKQYQILMNTLRLNSPLSARKFRPGVFWLLVGLALASFACVVVFGGGGMLWLTDPRWAYASAREGVISFFMVTQWLLMGALLYIIWSKRPNTKQLILISILFAIPCIWTGSKGTIFMNLLVAAVYYHFYIKRIPDWLVIASSPFMIAGSILTIFLQVHDGDFVKAVIYFQDYFDSTAWYLSKFKNEFRYGGCELSSLWYLVPRPLYPDKPWDWGDRIVDTTLYPGAAQIGYTPACLWWTTYYIDFGAAGVFVGCMITALIRRVSYEYYLRHKDRFFVFVAGVQLSMLRIFLETDILPSTIIVILALSIFVRLKIGASPSRRQPIPISIPAPSIQQ